MMVIKGTKRILSLFLLCASALNADFVKNWSKYYQTSLDASKENRARLVIENGYSVPSSAQKAIEIAATSLKVMKVKLVVS